MPFYEHECQKCKNISRHYYPITKDPDIKCELCEGETKRLLFPAHIGWERKIYNTFIKADDERAEAQQTDHMGPNPYNPLSGENINNE